MNQSFWIFFRRIVAFCYDTGMVIFSWFFAYEVRSNLALISEKYFLDALRLLPIVILIQFIYFRLFGLYRGVWRFASLEDLARIVKSIFFGTVTIACAVFLAGKGALMPHSIPLLYFMFLVFFLSFGRVLVRLSKDHRLLKSNPGVKRVLVVGAGDAAESLIRDMIRHRDGIYKPIVIVDDDRNKIGREIHGIRVVALCCEIKNILEKYRIDLIFIALPSITGKKLRPILGYCMAAGVPYRTLPGLHDIANGNVTLASLREVSLEDLLGRDVYEIDVGLICQKLERETILITGGGGSIGSELCRQIAALSPKRIIIVDNSEANLYHIGSELAHNFSGVEIIVRLVDVTNYSMLEHVFSSYSPGFVFHAAAYKHVPMLESQVFSAINNNIFGSKNVVDLSIAYKVKVFIQVSTDKAVNPTNVMGLTKRVSEMYCQSLSNKSLTKIITVRFGNVLGSVGSVVPLFQQQLRKGGPLTVTHPEITRYFMTIPEACRLILQAMALGDGGEIFVLDMGEPIKIKDLAEQIIRLAGKKVGEEIEIIYTGLRPGEKLWEDLFYEKEAILKTTHKKIFCVERENVNTHRISLFFDQIAHHYEHLDESALFSTLRKLVPEYSGKKEEREEMVQKEMQTA